MSLQVKLAYTAFLEDAASRSRIFSGKYFSTALPVKAHTNPAFQTYWIDEDRLWDKTMKQAQYHLITRFPAKTGVARWLFARASKPSRHLFVSSD